MRLSHPILAREGWLYIALSLLAAVIVTLWAGWMWASPLWLVVLFVVQFFRDPTRDSPASPGQILSPADGKIVFVGPATDPYLDRPALKISVFMNVFSVHSNRSPVAGTVREIWYSPGRFFNAALDKASEENERNAVWVRDSDDNQDIVFVQVAGLIARRILCYVKEGDHLDWGQRYGFIRFGSRVDLYLPESCAPRVRLGDKVTAGLDIVAGRSSE
jgi:phosphatidylserine decarboxylase